MKLTFRLTLVFVLYALALLAGVSWLAYSGGRDALRLATVSELQSTAIEKQAALNEWVEEKRMDISALASTQGVIESAADLIVAAPGSREAQNARTQFVMEVQPRVDGGEFQVLMLLDPTSGQVITATDPAEEGKFKEDRLFFLNGMNAPYVQNVYYSVSLQGPAMTASAPLRSADGKLVGILAGRLNLEEMDAIINRRAGGWQNDEAFLVNTSHLFVTQPRLTSDPAVLRQGVHTGAIDRCLERTSGAMSGIDYRGIPALIVYRWLPEHELCLVVKIDRAEALAPSFAFGRQVIAISVVALLGAIALAIFFSGSIARPIHDLQSGVMRFGQGDRDIRLPEKGPIELSDLAREFNRMAASLAEKDARLHEYATELERKVEERTATLKQREERYRSYIEVTGQIGWTTNPQGEVEEDMQSWRRFTGQSEDEVKGWGWSNALHPDDREHVTQAWKQAVATKTPYEVEYRLRRHDGIYRHFLGRGVPIYEDNGEIREWVGTSIDITERKQAEQIQELERARWQGIVEGIADEVWMCNEQGKMSLLNLDTITAMGLEVFREKSVEEVYQQVDIFHPDGRPRPPEQAPLLRSLQGEIVRGEEIMRHRQTGNTRYRQFSSAPTRDANGAITGAVAIVRDITDQKLAEEGLRRYELLSRDSRDIILFMRQNDGCILEANAAAEREYGYSREELLALTIQDLRAQHTQNLTTGQMAQADAGGILFETVHRRKDGSTFPVEVSSQGATISGVRTLVSIIRDIGERKQAEEEIKSLSRFPTENPNPVLRVQNDGQLTYANAASRELLEMWGCEVNGYLSPDLKDLISASLESGTNQSLDMPCNEKVFSVMIVPMTGSGYVNLYGRDITERKRAEDALLASEARYRHTLEAMLEGCQILGFDWRYLYLNDVADKHNRRPKEELLGNRYMDMWPGIESTHVFTVIQRCMNERESQFMENEFTFPDNSTGWFELRINPVPEGIVIFSIDITERKRAEVGLRQTMNELKHSNAELEQFAYVASHDLQEPLRGIAGLAQLLQQRYQGQLDSRADEYITHIVDGTQRMQTLINDLLAYSRIGRRGETIQVTEVRVALAAALENLDTAIHEYRATITNGSLPSVRADATQLIQLFQNLIGNAIKFRAQERPPQIHVAAADIGDSWQISVRDNGIGIEPQYYERIFQVFQRLHTRREYKGTGIGLAICKKIIDRHGGRIWVESEPGQGATFYFTLPKGN